MQASLSYFQKFSIGISPIHRSLNKSKNFKRTLSRLSANAGIAGGEEPFFFVRHFASTTDGNGQNSSARYLAGIPRLMEIGRLEKPKSGETYEAGQAFLHRIFSFRGVILFPWTTTVYDTEILSSDRSVAQPFTDRTRDTPPPLIDSTTTKDSAPTTITSLQTYYQVLVDHRDSIALKTIYQDDITARKDDPYYPLLHALKGFAYVAHDDILPYTPTEMVAIEHEHFSKFLTQTTGRSTNFAEKPALVTWRSKFQETLRLSEIRRETFEKVRISVMPFFLAYTMSTSSPKRRSYCWLYTLRLENFGRDAVVVKDEEWTILDSDMKKPVMVEKPLTKSQPLRLTPQSPAFQCQSRIQLPTRSGFIWGRLTMEREDGTTFHCRIPTLSLQSPKSNGGLASSPIIYDFPER